MERDSDQNARYFCLVFEHLYTCVDDDVHKQAFVRGDLHTTLTAPGISEILDFTFYPFGNAYIGNGPDVPCDALTCTVCLSYHTSMPYCTYY
jgi:hypothetical protein